MKLYMCNSESMTLRLFVECAAGVKAEFTYLSLLLLFIVFVILKKKKSEGFFFPFFVVVLGL